MKHHKKLILPFFFSAIFLIGTPLTNAFASNCFDANFSGLPYSITGVSSCKRSDRQHKSATNRCLSLAKQRYGTTARLESQSPVYKVTGGNTRRVCKRKTVLGCVDWARECSASYTKLQCKIRVCYPF